ncbi:MAG: dihydroneopterin aldolase [Planctomycetes bacterium]|nr:dihydroneopterin aldolase [Planctomycetota bacterium]
MDECPFDQIHIRDLQLRCVIGVYDAERLAEQDVTVNVTLHADLSGACASDELADTVDYHALRDEIVAAVEGSRFFLLERLAGRVAEVCLSAHGVQAVRVCADKPHALRLTRSVAVEIFRHSRDKAR